jgi:hypothetical protein
MKNKINKVIEESKYHEIEHILNDFKKGTTYSDSIEKIEKILSTTISNLLSAIEEEVKALKKCPDCKGSGETECGVDNCDKKGIHRCFRCHATGSVDIDFYAIQALLKSAKEQIK